MSFLDKDMAMEAVELAEPTISGLLERHGTRRDFHLIVSRRTGDAFEIVYEFSFGHDDEACDSKYKPIAEAKSAISARTGKDTRVVQLLHPEELEVGDVTYWGSVIQGDIIVAGSGVQAFFDETIAKVVMAIIIGLIEKKRGLLEQNAKVQGKPYYM